MKQTLLSQTLLGKDYDQQDYSPSFHSMLSRAVTKIYRRKDRKKLLRTNVICATFNEEEEETQRKSQFGFFANRKNSPNRTASKFFSTPRSTQPHPSDWTDNASTKSITSFYPKHSPNLFQGRNFRCNTDPMSSFKVKLTERIQQNNRCLNVNRCKYQQKGREDVGLGQMLTKESGRVMHNSRPTTRHKKAVNTCQVKGYRNSNSKWHSTPRSTSVPITFPNEFRPWDTQETDQQLIL